jgi:hypothetical protein
MDKALSVAQVAAMLNVSPAYVAKPIRDGKLRASANADGAHTISSMGAEAYRLRAKRRGGTEREKFQSIPDHAIAHIQQIVREAYLEAGEDVGGEILRAHLWQQALAARREMVAGGELISKNLFRQRLGLTERRLIMLLADGSVFTLEVDGAEYYPALLADPAHNRMRMQTICRIIVPAPPECRLHFLSSSRGSLGGRSPLQTLNDDNDFNRLRQAATAWAAEYSRTTVKMYEGEHEIAPKDVDTLYTAIAEIDPRKPLWERASEAILVHGYEWPLGPYSEAGQFTLFVERQTVGQSAPTPEGCVQIVVDGGYLRIRIVVAPGTALNSETVPAGTHKSFVDIAKRVIAHLKK